MVSSSSRRAPRGDKRKHKRQSRPRRQSSKDDESSAPVSRSEENNEGKLVNKDEEKMACSPRLSAALADTPDNSDQRIYHSGTEEDGEHGEMGHHYIGVRSRRAVDKMLNPGQFFLYYNKPSGVEIPVTIELKIGYMSSTKKVYHFPIQRFECDGGPYYAVMQTDTDVKMFPSIDSLVKHYHTFAHVGPESGSLETFAPPPPTDTVDPNID